MTDEITAAEHEFVEAAAPSAASRLRAFEDQVLGEDTTRISGAIERGVGSKYQRMSDAEKYRHGALERLVKAEEHLAATAATLEKAKAEHEAAVAAAEHDASASE